MPGAVLAVDQGGVLIPGLIIAACAFVSTVAIVLRRGQDKRARSEVGDGTTGGGPEGSAPSDGSGGGADWGEHHTDLLAWQQTQRHHVDAWLDAHERTLPELQPGTDPEIDAVVDEAMGNAATVCPDPEVAAMLHGMREAAHATRTAITGGDREGATEAHSTYARHRSGAVAAMNEAARDGAPPAG